MPVSTCFSSWATPREVLVLYNARWPDENGNFRSDSQDVAEYYAARRGIPTDQVSQRRRYFYTRRFAYELADLLPDREYHVRVSARDPFGNVGTATGTVKTLR